MKNEIEMRLHWKRQIRSLKKGVDAVYVLYSSDNLDLALYVSVQLLEKFKSISSKFITKDDNLLQNELLSRSADLDTRIRALDTRVKAGEVDYFSLELEINELLIRFNHGISRLSDLVNEKFPLINKSDFEKWFSYFKAPLFSRFLMAAFVLMVLIRTFFYVYSRKHSLVGEYFPNEELKDSCFTRKDSNIDFEWKEGSPKFGFKSDHFSVRWTGWLIVPHTGKYEFMTLSDDGVRCWINEQLIIEDWHGHTVTANRGSIRLEKGIVPIKIEYFEVDGPASISLLWRPEFKDKEGIISSKYFISEKQYIPVS